MNRQGKIVNWNDDKGFGFVEPNGGGDRAFVHIKAFTRHSRRPVNGDVIIYQLIQGRDKRFRANKIKFAGDKKTTSKSLKNNNETSLPLIFTFMFCGVLISSIFLSKLPLYIGGLYLCLSFITFIAYARDKSAAQAGRWRVRESTLHFLALIGGWPGALYAQKRLRHKNRKTEFKVVCWGTVILNISALIWLHTAIGVKFLHDVIAPLIDKI